MKSEAFSTECGCSSMVEQKLPKLLTSAVFRHVPRKPREKSAFQIKSLRAGCKPFSAPSVREAGR